MSRELSYVEVANLILEKHLQGDASATAYVQDIAGSHLSPDESLQVITKKEIEDNLSSKREENISIDINEPEATFFSIPLKGKELPASDVYAINAEVRMLADDSRKTIRMRNSVVRAGLDKTRGFDVLSDGSISLYTDTGSDVARIIPQRYRFGRNNVIREFMSAIYHIAKGVEVLQWKNSVAKELDVIHPATHAFMSKLTKPSLMRSMLAMKGQMDYVHNMIAKEGFKYEVLSEAPFDLFIKEMPPHFNPYELADQLLESLPINISRIFIRNEDVNCFVVLDGELPKYGYGMLSDCEGILHGDRVIIFIVNKSGSLLELVTYNFGVEQEKTFELTIDAAAEMWAQILQIVTHQNQIKSMRRWVGYWDDKSWLNPQYDCDVQLSQESEYIGPTRPENLITYTSRPYPLIQERDSMAISHDLLSEQSIGPEQHKEMDTASSSVGVSWMIMYSEGATPKLRMSESLGALAGMSEIKVSDSIVPVRPHLSDYVTSSKAINQVLVRDTLSPVTLYSSEQLMSLWNVAEASLVINSIVSLATSESTEAGAKPTLMHSRAGDTINLKLSESTETGKEIKSSVVQDSIKRTSYSERMEANTTFKGMSLLLISDTVRIQSTTTLSLGMSVSDIKVRDTVEPVRLKQYEALTSGTYVRAHKSSSESVRTFMEDSLFTHVNMYDSLSIPKGTSRIYTDVQLNISQEIQAIKRSFLGVQIANLESIGLSNKVKTVKQNDKTAARKYKIGIDLRAGNQIKGISTESKLKTILEQTTVSISLTIESSSNRPVTNHSSLSESIEANVSLEASQVIDSIVEENSAEQSNASMGITGSRILTAGTSTIKSSESILTSNLPVFASTYNMLEKTYSLSNVSMDIDLFSVSKENDKDTISTSDNNASTSTGMLSMVVSSSILENKAEIEEMQTSHGLISMVIIRPSKTETSDTSQVSVGISSIQFV